MIWHIAYILYLIIAIEVKALNNNSSNITDYFWQLTDIHWDLRYNESGNKNKMCHEDAEKENAGPIGNYFCDSPWILVKSAITTMAKINKKPRFILWTGDNAPHTNDPKPNFDVIFKTERNLTTELMNAFPDVTIIPVLGNHDVYPKDFYPTGNITFYTEYLRRSSWSKLLNDKAQEEFKKGGYFSFKTNDNITILSVNTNLYFKFNKLGTHSKDPSSQFQWLRSKFNDARKDKQKVILAAHSPPGFWERLGIVPFFNESYNDAYVDLVSNYSDVILAQFYGHEHTDAFRIFVGDKGQTSIGYLAPSVTPWHPTRIPGGTAMQPSIRIYSYNPQNIVDYNQYHFQLKRANKDSSMLKPCYSEAYNESACLQNMSEYWISYYNATSAFGIPSLTPANIQIYHHKLHKNNQALQDAYVRNSGGYTQKYCNESCSKLFLCAIHHLKIEDFRQCTARHVNPKPVVVPFSLKVILLSLGIAIIIFMLWMATVLKRKVVMEKITSAFATKRDSFSGYSPLIDREC